MSLHRCRINGEFGVLCDTHLHEASVATDAWYFSSVPKDETIRIYTIQPSIEGDYCEICLTNLTTTINDLEWALENYDGACCGMACDCHDNNKSDLLEAYARMADMNIVFVDGQQCHVTYVDGRMVVTKL